MKKIYSFMIVLAAVAMVSCGGNTNKKPAADAEAAKTECTEGCCTEKAEACCGEEGCCEKADSTACCGEEGCCKEKAEGECCKEKAEGECCKE